MALDVKCPARNVQTWLRWDRLVSASSSLEADRLRMWSSVDFVYRMNPQLPVCCSILIKMMFPLISVDSKLDGCTEIEELWQKLHKICLHLITISWVFWMWLSQNFWSINDKNNSIMRNLLFYSFCPNFIQINGFQKLFCQKECNWK